MALTRRRTARLADLLSRAGLGVFATGVMAASAGGAEPPAASWSRDVRPLFVRRCWGCHQPARPLAGLDISSVEAAHRPGRTGAATFRADLPEASRLVMVLQKPAAGRGSAALDPPHDGLLAPLERALVVSWIRGGAKDDSEPTPGSRTGSEAPSPDPRRPQRGPRIRALAASPDGETLAVAGDGEILLYRLAGLPSLDGRAPQPAARLRGMSEQLTSLDYSPRGDRLAATGGNPGEWGEWQVWDPVSKSLRASSFPTSDSLFGVRFSPDGRGIAFGGPDHVVRAVRMAEGEALPTDLLYQAAHQDWVLGTAWSKDGSHVVSASRDRTLRLTEVATQRFIDTITSITPGALQGGLLCVDRRPDRDEAACGGVDGRVQIYKIFRSEARAVGDDYNKILELPAADGRIPAVRYNAAGDRLVFVAATGASGLARVHEIPSGKLLWETPAPLPPLDSLAIAPDGETFYVGGSDGQVRAFSWGEKRLLWELAVPVRSLQEKPPAAPARIENQPFPPPVRDRKETP